LLSYIQAINGGTKPAPIGGSTLLIDPTVYAAPVRSFY